jgi:hypothetical protein
VFYTEADAIAALTASYAGRPPEELYAERVSLVRELESAQEAAERRLCADHLAVLDAELNAREAAAGPAAGEPQHRTDAEPPSQADAEHHQRCRSPTG